MSEYAKRIEHQEYFELQRNKAEATSPSEISGINKQLECYRKEHDFDEKDEFPLFSKLNVVPEDQYVFLECKTYLDSEVRKKILRLREIKGTYSKGVKSLSGINDEIRDLKETIERLKNDAAYQDLKKAETGFDNKAKEIFSNLRINFIWTDRKEAVDRLKREKKRITDVLNENREEIEDRNSAYRRMSKYITSEDVIEKDSDAFNPILLKTVNVIGMTCTAQPRFKDDDDNDVRLNELNIDTVIVDEVSKVPFIEVLQPILYGKTVILVGDHKQLPPMFDRCLNDGEEARYDNSIINQETERMYQEMYENSFFEQLFDSSPDSMKSILHEQYRMHPDIMEVDNVFYGGKLEFKGNPADKEHHLEVCGNSGRKIIGSGNHVVFINVEGKEEKESGSTSFSNAKEADTVVKLLELINNSCSKDRDGNKLAAEYRRNKDPRLSAGVICTYADQARKIRDRIKSKRYNSFNVSPDERFMVKTVDDFQGDERDIIFLTMVRTRKSDFLKDFRRINVAISRARRLLIIVGNRKALESMNVMIDGVNRPVYRDMIRAIERKNGVLEKNAITGDD